jgi:hypothetical protein
MVLLFFLWLGPLRIEFDGVWHHVMNRGAGRRTIFKNDDQKVGIKGIYLIVCQSLFFFLSRQTKAPVTSISGALCFKVKGPGSENEKGVAWEITVRMKEIFLPVWFTHAPK